MIAKGLGYLRSNAIGVLALFVALGGTSYAASGGFSSNGNLQGCAARNGTLTLLKSGKKCKRGQSSITWSAAGPTGAKGATGTAGAAGAAGATGPPAPSLWARVRSDGVLQAGSGVASLTGTDPYKLKFIRDVSSCGLTATINNGPAVIVLATNNEGVVEVATATKEVSLAPSEFTLVVTC